MLLVLEGEPDIHLAPLRLGRLAVGVKVADGLVCKSLHTEVCSEADEAAADRVIGTLLTDPVLQSAAAVTNGQIAGSTSGLRDAVKLIRVWFIEVAVYRVLASVTVCMPNLHCERADLSKVVQLSPGCLQQGLPGQVRAAEHFAGLLRAANMDCLGIRRYAQLSAFTCGSHQMQGMLQTTIPNVQGSPKPERHCALQKAGKKASNVPADCPAPKRQGGS
jgi:hypothetical protein